MNSQKNQDNAPQSLLDGIQGEVSAENAPLLQFITKYAPYIAGFVLLLLLILGGTGAWKWYHAGKQKDAQDELGRISMRLKGSERDEALANLAKKAPDSAKLYIYLSLAKSAQENGNTALAADAYAKVAKMDGDGALGMAAALGGAGSLLKQSKYAQALSLLQELGNKLPWTSRSMQFQQMLAEAAYRAGKLELAMNAYRGLAEESRGQDAAYYRFRADAIASQIDGEGK